MLIFLSLNHRLPSTQLYMYDIIFCHNLEVSSMPNRNWLVVLAVTRDNFTQYEGL